MLDSRRAIQEMLAHQHNRRVPLLVHCYGHIVARELRKVVNILPVVVLDLSDRMGFDALHIYHHSISNYSRMPCAAVVRLRIVNRGG